MLDKLIQKFDPTTKEGRAKLFSVAWKASIFMLVLGYLIIIYLLFR